MRKKRMTAGRWPLRLIIIHLNIGLSVYSLFDLMFSLATIPNSRYVYIPPCLRNIMDGHTNPQHRAEEIAAEYGFHFSVDEAMNKEYYQMLEAKGTLNREVMGWNEFIQTVIHLPHNKQKREWGYGQHISSNVRVTISNAGGNVEDTWAKSYEKLVIHYLHNAGFYLTAGYNGYWQGRM